MMGAGRVCKSGFQAPCGTWIRVYLSAEPVVDRWTVVLDSKDWNASVDGRRRAMLGLSDAPDHPQGFSQFTEGDEDRRNHGRHLGREILWSEFPEHLQRHVLARISP